MKSNSPSHWPISILASLSALVTMLVPLVMVRLLPVEQMGTYKIFFLYVVMVPVFSMTGGLISGLGFWAGQGPRGLRAIQLSNGQILMAGVLVGLAVLAGAPWVAGHFGWPLRFALYLPACILGMVCSNFLEESSIVTRRVWFGAIFLSGSELLRSAVVVLVAWQRRDLESILAAYTLMSVAKVVASLVIGRSRGLVGFRFSREELRTIWEYSFPVSLSTLLGVFATYGDQLILSNVVSPAQFALYTMGCLTVPPLMILEQSVTRLMVPELAAAFAAGESGRAARDFRRAVEQLFWLLIPAVTGLIVFADPIVELLFTSRYAESAPYLRWFALTYLILAVPSNPVPRARGEGGWILRTSILFAPVPLVLCFALGKPFGAFGVLWGIILSRTLLKAYALGYIRRSTGWKWREFLPIGHTALFALASVGLGFACTWLRDPLGGGLRWFLGAGGLFTLCYFPLSLFLVNWLRRVGVGKRAVTRVLLFSQHLEIGGLERMVLTLAEGLGRDPRWKVHVFSHDSSGTAANPGEHTLIARFLEAGIPVEAFRKPPGFSPRALYRLIRNIYRNRIDVLHTHDLGPLIYGVLASVLTLGRVRIVHTQHSFVHLKSARKYGWYERVFTAFADRLTVVNDDLVGSYEQLGVARRRIQVVYNGVGFQAGPPADRAEKVALRTALLSSISAAEQSALAPHSSDHWILYLARFHPVKGQRTAIELWEELRPEIRKTSVLLLQGPDADPRERSEVERVRASASDRERIILLGATGRPREWLAAADLFLSCSQVEGMPLGPLEAIGSGLPSVLSGIPGHAFLAEVSRQYPPGRPAEGARALEALLSEPGFGTRAYYFELWRRSAEIRARYSLEAMVASYARIYARGEDRAA